MPRLPSATSATAAASSGSVAASARWTGLPPMVQTARSAPTTAMPPASHMPLARAWMKALWAASAAAGGRFAPSEAVPRLATSRSC